MFITKKLLAKIATHFLSSQKKNAFTACLKLISAAVLLAVEPKSKLIGSLAPTPSRFGLLAAIVGLKHNLNHLGNVYAASDSSLSFSLKIEKEAIEQAKKMFGVRGDFEGYVTSGGTESNLFLMWGGREWLRQETNTKDATVLLTDFTHYSIRKAARILDLPQHRVAISENSWGMSPQSLQKELERLLQEGKNAFLLPVTLGYSSTGAHDPLPEVLQVIRRFQKKTGARFFVWTDAAMQGFPLAFSSNTKYFSLKKHPLIQGYGIDFHKLGKTPLPSGLVLYAPILRKIIQRPIEYLEESDATVSGSRPGFPALAIWAEESRHSSQDYKNMFAALILEKEKIVRQIKSFFPKALVIHPEASLTFCVRIDKNFPRISQHTRQKYGLVESVIRYRADDTSRQKILRHYKFHFLSKDQAKTYQNFLAEITQT